ncbi:MAG: tripartite tricarboxylate transporter permease [Burkholderiaceae bacterium]
MIGLGDYILLGLSAVFVDQPVFVVFGLPVTMTVLMTAGGLFAGVVIGAIPGLSGPFAMAVSLPILISVFGFNASALLPVLGFLIGVMKGATVGGAVPAILFNTPGTPDALLTTFDGYPMTRRGQSRLALRVAHRASVIGDSFSDLVLITCAPFLAVLVEAYLGFTEKAALILLSLAFVAAVVGRSPVKGVLSGLLGLLCASIAKGEDQYPRLSLGLEALADGIPIVSAVLGVLILGEIFKAIEDIASGRESGQRLATVAAEADRKTPPGLWRRLMPVIGRSALIGTAIGALPGIGSTLAATLGYATAKKLHRGPVAFGEGAPEGVAATEAANSAVSGANLIPVLSLGIPGNVAAVFLILAAESIGGLNPGPGVFRLSTDVVNSEAVMVFGLFSLMIFANLLNWTVGGVVMRAMGHMVRIPPATLMPIVLLVTITAVYVQETSLAAVIMALLFGALGYLMRRLDISVLPFAIAFILERNLETGLRQAFSASGANPWFLFQSPLAVAFLVMAVAVVIWFSRGTRLS